MTKTNNIGSFKISKDWEMWEILAEKIKGNLIEVKNGYIKPDTNTGHKNEEVE